MEERMRLLSRTTLIAGLAVAAAIGGTANAGSSVDRATGGGQILINSSGHGPGDTITFQARGTETAATGSVNVIDRDRDATTAKGQGYHFQGTVSCLRVDANTAQLSGTGTAPDGSETAFILVVVDNGEGAAADNDSINLTYVDDPSCNKDDGDNDGAVDLARGNAQVYDAG
jgi:hypothetical protein